MSGYSLEQLDEKAKLVIWDLDETFWKGTLSEGNVTIIDEHVEIVKTLTDRGIINSICSKNDFDEAKEVLEDEGIWEYFVFPKIEWSPKGELVRETLEQAQLRPPNTIFIDDNHMNLEEVSYYNEEITTISPDEIDSILDNPYFEGKDDSEHTRLEQYKILEEKNEDRTEYVSNEEFLNDCNIRATVLEHPINHLDRVTELVNRTNQLNFTKRRDDKDRLRSIIKDEDTETGCIRVHDDYGDYGIVGFYGLEDGELVHFTFSCRLLDLHVEQWTYAKLGFPDITVQGETAATLDDSYPSWITEVDSDELTSTEEGSEHIQCFIKGGCDLEQLSHYLNYHEIGIQTEFNYPASNGLVIHREHSEVLRSIEELSSSDKSELVERLPFYEWDIFETEMFDSKYDVVVYSVLMDYTQAVYQHRENPEWRVAYGDYEIPFTSNDSWDVVLDNLEDSPINEQFLEQFSDEFEHVGPVSEEQFRSNVRWIRNRLPEDTLLILVNGTEIPFEYEWETNRYERHEQMNEVLSSFVEATPNTRLLDVRKHVSSEADLTDNVRHYRRECYKDIADEVADIVATEFGVSPQADRVKQIQDDFEVLLDDVRTKVGRYLGR